MESLKSLLSLFATESELVPGMHGIVDTDSQKYSRKYRYVLPNIDTIRFRL